MTRTFIDSGVLIATARGEGAMDAYAYVYAITATAGYSLQAATRRLDDSGIDATITVPGQLNSKRLPRSLDDTE